MPKHEPKFRRPLNNQQVQLLQTLYKFRFATAQLIAKSQGSKHPRIIRKRLKILVDQEYIGQNYDSSYKIKGRPATYYLLLEAIRYLRQQPYATQRALRSMYYDRKADDKKIAHYLNVFAIYVEFKRLYPGEFNFFSSSELKDKKHLPKYLPDVYLSRKTRGNSRANDFFLDSYEEATYYRHLQTRIRQYIAYAESDKWQDATKRPLPTIIMVCETKSLERRMLRIAARELDTSYADLIFLAIDKEALTSAQNRDQLKWSNALEPGSPLAF